MPLDRLLRPRSIAIVGASERPSVGRTLVEALDGIGFRGDVYPINPKYESLLGRRCYPSVAELPRGVDFLEYLVDDPATRVIAMFLETVREPERFVAALDRAADRGKPVVVLKVGRSDRTRRAISSHTGGLAGEARVFSAVLRAHRAIEVAELDELTEVIAAVEPR